MLTRRMLAINRNTVINIGVIQPPETQLVPENMSHISMKI
jgi:hypothetical protein